MQLRARLVMSFSLKDVVESKRQAFKDVVADSAMRIEQNAKGNCPVDTGRLRSDIKIRFTKEGLAAYIGTDVFYAPFVEFGTGRRGAASNVQVPPEVTYVYGPRPGQPARPFLFPALEAERPTFEQNTKNVLKVR